MAPSLLHGTLDVTIYGIDKLSYGWQYYCNEHMGPKQMGKRIMKQLKRYVLCNPNLSTQLYATVDLGQARVARTRMVDERSRPEWGEEFRVYCGHTISHIIFTVKDDDLIAATLIGRAYVPVEEVIKGFIFDRWVNIMDEDLNPLPGNSKIHVKMCFHSAVRHEHWSKGIPSHDFEGVPRAFFQQRKGCKVTLYQDAHVDDDVLLLSGVGAMSYKPQRCWEDVFEAMNNAEKFIYITGWSVYTEITLVRDKNRPGWNVKLGELLKRKADEGVKVLMLVWDDRTAIPELNTTGLMATHGDETDKFFKNTKVKCILCPRNPDHGQSYVQIFETGSMFTHHQKTIIIDGEAPENKRRIVSFVGGIDLCDGRYDTQDHPLFKTLDGVHKEDFHQPNFPDSSVRKGGPREPWHDIHCKLEGPVAWDVLYNFEQRWERQVVNENDKKLLFSRTEINGFTVKPPVAVTSPNDPETWNVQIFRSIDGGAVTNFPRDPTEARKKVLVTDTDSVFDRSIQDAYINAIRRAKRFIYIENQYFLGSSFAWKASDDFKPEDIGALHLVPRELSLKIVSKIEAGERFTVYVVIPMWPEGVPESDSVQAILDWQRRTMEMMYTDIAEALKKKNLHTDPREYLTFFCLGNRESKRPGEHQPEEPPTDPNSDYHRAQQSRRFMIYVHAKMMIVDDEYIIIGSANINQRSMDGARDTEIAMGAYQPHHLDTSEQRARGQIFGFRMALWREHYGGWTDPVFHYPESAICVQIVNHRSDQLWAAYNESDPAAPVTDLQGHLLRYPVDVTGDGRITNLPGPVSFFPDTKAPILGKRSKLLKPILTT